MTTALVVGATGELGRRVVARLREAGVAVRALVRPGRDNEVTRAFAASGVEIVLGDLKEHASLAQACRGADVVVSSASSTSNRLDGDSIETVDELGNLALVQAAESASVSHFVFVSFADIGIDFPLNDAKKSVERRLEALRAMTHTVLKPAYFMETWLSGLVPKPSGEPVPVFGSGNAAVSWIAREDVARCVTAAVTNPAARNRTVSFGGPEAVSQLEVLEVLSSAGAPKTSVQPVPESHLERGLSVQEPLGKSLSGLMLGIARGLELQPASAVGLGVSELSTVRDFAERLLRPPSPA